MNVSGWSGVTAHWRTAADWSNGVPDASTDAEFTAPGSYTVTLSRSGAFDVGAVDLDAPGATFALQGSLTIGGVFDLKAGILAMSQAGVIQGGDLMMDGGTLSSQGGVGSKGGTLDAVHLAGTLDLSGAVEQLNITNGLIGMSGRPAAEIKLSGGEDILQFVGIQTFDNATIVLDDSVTYSVVYATKTLTLGSNATLTTTAFGPEGVLAGAAVINNGSIIAAASGAEGSLNIGLSRAFTNNGVVEAASDMNITATDVVNGANGAIDVGEFIALDIQGSFTNLGSMTIAESGSLDIASNTSIVNKGRIAVGAGSLSLDQSAGPGVVTLSNTGAISVGAHGSLSLLLNFTVASLGNTVDTGRLYIGGTFDNAGGVVRLGKGPIFGGTGTTLGYGGLISGGTVVLGTANLAYTGGGMTDLTFEGAVNLSAANAAINLDGGVAITGANGTGPGIIDLTGRGATLTFFDLMGTVANGIDNVTINAGNAHGPVTIALFNYDGAAETLTFGAHAKIVSKAAGAQVIVLNQAFGDGAVINHGEIDAEASGGSFSVTIPTLENDGEVMVANSDTFTLTGALSGNGKLTLATGGVAALGAAASNQSVAFADATGTLKLASVASFGATLVRSGRRRRDRPRENSGHERQRERQRSVGDHQQRSEGGQAPTGG